MPHIITIDASPSQLSKLRRGLPVRIKKGTGFNVIVHPESYHLVTRAFAKDKGIQIQLSPEEIEANKSLSPEQHLALKESQPEMAGQGIFGKKFDRGVRKVLGKHLQKKIYGDLRHALPGIQAGLDSAIVAGATALSAAQPELAPFLLPASAMASSYLNDYLENPSEYQKHGKSGIKGPSVRSMAEQFARAKVNEKLNEKLGTNFDYMSRAGIEDALAQKAREQLDAQSIASRFIQPPAETGEMSELGFLMGHGLYGGSLMSRAKRHYTTMPACPIRDALMSRREIGSISGRGTLMSYSEPPALMSQPLGANFQFQHFLPPAYQHFNSGSGLYAGHGLY